MAKHVSVVSLEFVGIDSNSDGFITVSDFQKFFDIYDHNRKCVKLNKLHFSHKRLHRNKQQPRAGFRTGQELPRGLHNQGPPHMSCHLSFFGILG